MGVALICVLLVLAYFVVCGIGAVEEEITPKGRKQMQQEKKRQENIEREFGIIEFDDED